ncbi:MAG: serine/threonine protein kinase [Tannerellaceae bacterium]|nr:serine/threonine protein kinase [Tannerellaceae bacterium]
MELQENILFHNRYHLIRLLGRGGYSEVWLAEDSKTGLEIALKVYAPGTGLDEDGVQIFTQEFALVFNLNHSNLLKPTFFDEEERRPYLIMPYCKFGSVSKMIGQMDEDMAWRFLHDVASGLNYLHSQEPAVIHQDIKPDNIMMDENHNFLITDFGISVKVRHTLRRSMNLKDSPTNSGTLSYMGPERFSRNPTAVKASDVWALGATIYELLEGDTPFGMHGGIILKSGAEIPDMKDSWSQDLKTIVSLCLHIDPWDRPTAARIVEWTEAHKRAQPCDFSGFKSDEADSQNLPPLPEKEIPEEDELKATRAQPRKTNKKIVTGSIITILIVLGIAAFLLINGKDSLLKNTPVNEQEKEFAELVALGDSLFLLQEERTLKQALETYRRADDMAVTYQIANTHTPYIRNQIAVLTHKTDSLFRMHVENAETYIGMDDKELYPNIIDFLEKALALKDDPDTKGLLDTYKNK